MTQYLFRLNRSTWHWQKYFVLASLAIQRALTYRARYLINALATLLQVGVMYYLWRGLYTEQSRIAGYTWADIRTYLFLVLGLNLFLTFQTETKMSASIRDGSIAMELVKPIDFQRAQLAEAIGSAVVEGLIFAIGSVFSASILFGVLPPAQGGARVLLVLMATIAAFLLKFLLALLTGILCFWTTNVIGLVWARTALTLFFSGGLVPLSFLPNWLQRVAFLLPFQGTVYTPVSIYLGRWDTQSAIVAIAVQYLWIAALWWSARVLFAYGIRTVTIYGG